MRRILLVLVVFMLFLPRSGGASANLVSNGGFETSDFGGWTQTGNTELSFVDVYPHTGTYAAWLGPVGSMGFLSQMVPTTPGNLYNIHYWLQHDPFGDGLPSRFQVFWNGALLDEQTDLGTFAYTEGSHFNVMATGASTELKFGFQEDTDYFQFDDVVVTAVPEPAMVVLMLAGLVAVWWRAGPHARRAGLVATLVLGQAVAPSVAMAQVLGDFTPEGIQKFLDDNAAVRTPAKFLQSLPAEFRQHWIMMTHSESAQTGSATSPRLILPNATASRVFGVALDSKLIEYIQFDTAVNRFRFHAIDTENGAVTKDDSSCATCHASERANVKQEQLRPNWDAYDSWGGMLPFNRDRFYEGSLEEAAFKKLMLDLKDDPVVSQLALPKGMTRDGTGALTMAFAPCDAGILGAEPCKTDSGVAALAVPYKFDAVNQVVSFPGPEAPINVNQGGKYLRLHHSLEGDGTDQGRGVRLFDNFTGFNATRIAQEIVDFPRNPVDIRYVALAIAKGCVTDKTLGKFAPNAALKKLLAYQTSLDANVRTFANLVTDTRTRQESLPQMKADLQARNLKGLIEAAGNMPTAAVIVPEIARRSRTNPGMAFALDKRTGFMVDRELYDTNQETMRVAMFRLYLEGLGMAVDKWSLSVMGRSQTYTFGDLLAPIYFPEMITRISASLPGVAVGCNDLAVASVRQYLRGF